MSEITQDRESLIRDCFPLVKKIARRVSRIVPGSDIDDLVGEGCLGLIRAIDTFDPSRGPSLERYASRIVAGAMLNGVRKLDPVSERVRREMREAERERYAIAGELGSLPSQSQMEVRRPALRRAALHAYRYSPLSLDGPLPSGEHLGGDWSADPAAIAVERCEREGIQTALRSIPLRQRFVLTLHYYKGQSLHQIGRTMAISPQRASQLHTAALKNLRRALNAAD
ncbi:MAG TPA: sigma-70 family RNA polymerase sigma factor [Candidatus Baltobacteraceae bacterium]|jgi:RNA polymerase sigma factor for flagellar operon FliA|nr:sigma-70 family RNA polymerase sigma factor [Candidatus Baltobacteraceae bacterium]